MHMNPIVSYTHIKDQGKQQKTSKVRIGFYWSRKPSSFFLKSCPNPTVYLCRKIYCVWTYSVHTGRTSNVLQIPVAVYACVINCANRCLFHICMHIISCFIISTNHSSEKCSTCWSTTSLHWFFYTKLSNWGETIKSLADYGNSQ